MQYKITVDVDYEAAVDEASLLQDVNTIITKAFNERTGVNSFQIESFGLAE
jgi:hypothetical protein